MMAVFLMFPVRCPRCQKSVQGLLASGRAGKFQGFRCPQCGQWSEGYAGEVDHPLLHTVFDILSDILKGERELTEEGKKFIIDFFDHPEKYPWVDLKEKELSCLPEDDRPLEEFMAFLEFALQSTIDYWQGKD